MKLSDFGNVQAIRNDYFRHDDNLKIVRAYRLGTGNNGPVDVVVGSHRLCCEEHDEASDLEAWDKAQGEILTAMEHYLLSAKRKLRDELKSLGVEVDDDR